MDMERQTKPAMSNTSKDTNNDSRAIRRPFNREAGIVIAKDLFHEHGYDAVGVAELTRALGINPPSLYAAYGSKAGLYGRCLSLYLTEGNLPADEILRPGRQVSDAIRELFVRATEVYTKSRTKRGCMVSEGMRAVDSEVRLLAKKQGDKAATFIEHFIAQSHPENARELADYAVVMLRGLSAEARAGCSRQRLIKVAHLAGEAFEACLLSKTERKK